MSIDYVKTYYVFTHESLRGIEIEAASKKEAVVLGVKAREGAAFEGGYYGAEAGNLDGPGYIPGRPATPLATPYAVAKPKKNYYRYRVA